MKFNKNKCFFASVYVAAVSAMTFTGFTSYAAEQNAQINETLSLIRGEEIQWGVSEIVQNAQKTTVEETLTAVNEAKAAYEAKLEEERKAAEEAERIAREQAEKAAALQAEKELLASLIFCDSSKVESWSTWSVCRICGVSVRCWLGTRFSDAAMTQLLHCEVIA